MESSSGGMEIVECADGHLHLKTLSGPINLTNVRNGHIEIITSVEPLQAASFKFHPVKTECLVEAGNGRGY